MPTARLNIEALASGGRGVARKSGLVWLVEGGVPGDEVEAAPVRRRRRLVEGRVVTLVRPSAHRRAAACPIQGRCGGCPWMVLDETAQRDWKRRILADALERIGRLGAASVEPVVPSPASLAYRNKVEFSFGVDGRGRVRLGLHAPSGALVDVERCLLQSEAANRVLSGARAYFLDGPGRSAAALRSGGEPVRLVVRRSEATGDLLVALRSLPGDFEEAAGFAQHLRGVPGVAAVARIVTRPGRRGGTRVIPLWGPPWLEERIAGIRFRLPAATFFQVNPGAAERLLEVVLEMAGAVEGGVLELFGGVGVFGLALARRGASVTVCEADPEAVACGREAAAASGLSVRFLRTDAREMLPHRWEGRRPSLVVADPPRAGLGTGLARAVARLGTTRVLLVSCDPATLARDARVLVDNAYALRRVVPVDLFPQTPHVEAVALFERAEASGDRTARDRREEALGEERAVEVEAQLAP